MSFFTREASDTPAPEVQEMVPGEGMLRARFKTTKGEMVAELYEEQVPRTVANFVALATGSVEWMSSDGPTERPLYSGTIFHRVIPNFMLQGGDPEGSGRGGPGWRFGDEFHPELRHTGKGVLSMANAGPGTNGSQFFVCQVATPHLDNRHAVFGKVIEGLDVIDTIANVATGSGDRPVEDVVLEEVEIFRV